MDSLRYDPFGAVLARIGAGAAQARGYVGGEPDPATGLLYLSARWYSPELGIFLSPDILVQDAYDPLSWASYAYCRNNPVTFADPSGRSVVGIVLACLAIAALIVVTIVSYGTASGVTAVGIGVIVAGAIAGGVVGGIAAYKKSHNTENVIEGVLVGAAVGGWAGFATVLGGGAWRGRRRGMAHGFRLLGIGGRRDQRHHHWCRDGFCQRVRRGKGHPRPDPREFGEGAVIGHVAGAVLGGLSSVFKLPSGGVVGAAEHALKEQHWGAARCLAVSLPGRRRRRHRGPRCTTISCRPWASWGKGSGGRSSGPCSYSRPSSC